MLNIKDNTSTITFLQTKYSTPTTYTQPQAPNLAEITEGQRNLTESTQLVPSTHDPSFPIINTTYLLTSLAEGHEAKFGE